jgi:hypothetical protein
MGISFCTEGLLFLDAEPIQELKFVLQILYYAACPSLFTPVLWPIQNLCLLPVQCSV